MRKWASSDPVANVGAETTFLSPSSVSINPSVGGTHPLYGSLYALVETLGAGNSGDIYYQISNNGTDWYYYDSSMDTWSTASNETDYNTAGEINAYLPDFTTQYPGSGNFYFKAFLIGNNEPVELDSLDLIYSPVTANLSTSSVSVTEGGATATYTVQLSNQPTSDVTITLASSDTSYGVTVSPATLTFAHDASWHNPQTVTVTAVNDTRYEAAHTATITHTASSGDTAFDGMTIASVTANITDNDSQPALSIASASATEGSDLTFNVTLSGSSAQAITVDYASSNATAASGSDYTAVSGTLTFSAGETSKTITVHTTDDASYEGTETFTVTISNPANATLATSSNTGTINDNDAAPASGGSAGGASGSDSSGGSGGDSGSGGASGTGGSSGSGATSGSGGSSGSGGASGTGGSSGSGGTGGSSGSGGSGGSHTLTVTSEHVDPVTYVTHDDEEVTFGDAVEASDTLEAGAEIHIGGFTITIPIGDGDLSSIVVSSLITSDGDENILISSPHARSGRGASFSLRRSEITSDIDLRTEASLSISALTNNSSALTLSENAASLTVGGQQEGDNFGAFMATGDFNGDGMTETIITAPGAGLYGVAYFFDEDMNLLGTIVGSSSQPIDAVFISQIMGNSTLDLMFFGGDNPAFNSSLTRPTGAISSASLITSLEGSSSIEGSIDLAEIDTDSLIGSGNHYQYALTCDVNGDGYNDLIAATTEGHAAIFFGPISSSTNLTYSNANSIITGEDGSFGAAMACADLNHDGRDDLIFGMPDYGNGEIDIVYGRYFWDPTASVADDVTRGYAARITGSTEGSSIGSDLLVQANTSGAFTLYTPEGVASTLALTLSSSADIDQTSEVHVGGSSSAVGCSLIPEN